MKIPINALQFLGLTKAQHFKIKRMISQSALGLLEGVNQNQPLNLMPSLHLSVGTINR